MKPKHVKPPWRAAITWDTFYWKHHAQNMLEKLFPGPFLKNQNWTYLWINSLKFYSFYFCRMLGSGQSKYIETKLQTPCIYLIQSFLSKKRSGASLPASCSAWFLKKNISLVIIYYPTKFHFLVFFSLRDIGQYVYCSCLLTRMWGHKFGN